MTDHEPLSLPARGAFAVQRCAAMVRVMPPVEVLPDVWLLSGFADSELLATPLASVVEAAPLRRFVTARGRQMAVASTNCGAAGWTSDARGYRYTAIDPQSGEPWPAMPAPFGELAQEAARAAGFGAFTPDACLVNRYVPGVGMGAHQDRDEASFDEPIVSVSLGIPARFFVVGPERRGRATPIDVADGDVVVFGASARLHYHGVRPLKQAEHPRFGAARWNLTFRRALQASRQVTVSR